MVAIHLIHPMTWGNYDIKSVYGETVTYDAENGTVTLHNVESFVDVRVRDYEATGTLTFFNHNVAGIWVGPFSPAEKAR